MFRLSPVAIQDGRRRACGRAFCQVPALWRVQSSEAIPEPETRAARPHRKGPLVWLFVPQFLTSAALAFAPGSADSTLDFTLPNPDIVLWVMSSETLSQRPLSWLGWRTRPWLRLLFGTISNPSTADLGAAEFISSLPVIPANRSATPATGAARKIPGISGQMSPASCATFSPDSASSKTSPGICPLASTMSPETFKAWAAELQRRSYQRRKSAGLTSASGCSFWPTPTATMSANRACIRLGPGVLRFQRDLNQTGKQVGTGNAAMSWTLLTDMMRGAGWEWQNPRSSHPCRVILLNGEQRSDDGLRLNPAFTDWLMGWPIGWSDPSRPVTEWSPWLRRARGMI